MSETRFAPTNELISSQIATGMSAAQGSVLAAEAVCKNFSDGEVIVDDEDTSNDLLVLLSGRAQVQGLFEQEVNTVEAGSVLGEVAFLDGQPRSATVLSIGDSRCAFFNSALLQKLQAEHPDVAAIMLQNLALSLATKLRSTMRMINALTMNE